MATGFQPGHNMDVEIGVAFDRSRQPSEFGLPENYSDPDDYCGKTPPCERVIGS